MSTSSSTSSVRVAVRVRPLTAQEIQQNCHNRITFTPNLPQITVEGNRSFTFDYAYPPSADQEQVYSTCVVPLLQKYLDGYNSTILAYGQTGSGKTYSMGIGLESATEQQDGIVPRFIHSLFDQLTAKSNAVSGYSYQVLVTFLELYNEDLVDLLRQPRIDGLNVSIREDSQGNICWIGVREEPVNNAHELLELLNRGSIARTTASTDMNRVSSRSHAIFSVILKQTIPDDNVEKRLVSKFHFVDLAGSERLKRTNAVGDRAREGISINTGLLALGNVISALGDESRKVSHVPYRDSKLTRLLQDSLGGNSQTLMLACVSPADSNYTETLNTLKYANRARNIRNRVTVNQEVGGESDRLKAHVLKLKEELKSNEEFLRAVNQEMDSLKSEVEVLTATMTKMTQELALTKCERDMLKSQHGSSVSLDGLMAEYAQTIERLRTEIKLQTGRQQQTIITTTSPPSPPLPPSPPRSSHTLTSSSHAAATEQQQQQQQQQHPVEKSPKKKRHSYRFGSKRGRRRVSINFNSSPKSKLKPSSRPNTSDDAYQMIQKAKSELLDEMAFLKAAQRWSFHAGSPWHRASTPPTPDDSDIMEFANSFPDQSLTLASSHEQRHQQLQHQLPASTYNLLVKFQQCVKSKSELIQLLERSEAQRSEMQELHANAISELTNKKNAALVQHRRDMNDMRSQYESRLKKLTCELNALKRKHAQAIRSAETARSKSNAIILGLKQKLDKANSEKKKMIKKLKQESDRAREKCSHLDKEMAKLKRQESQAVQARKRMERDVVQHKATAKRATEEMMELSGQMKQVALMLKKIMATEKMDKSVLAKAMACASVRGYLIRQSLQRGSIRRRKIIPKNMNDATKLAPPLYHKKRLLHRAIAMHVRATRTEVADLKQKRDRLQREQQELLAERQRVLQDEAQRLGNNVERTSSSVDGSVPQYMDDRIDTITVQLDFYNDQLARLEQKGEDQWTDVQEAVDGVQELEQFIKDDDPQVAYQVALALIRSLEPEEARPVAEALMDEIIELKQKQISPTLVQGMDATIQRLQRTLVQMRRQAAATGWISSEQDGINTVFDCLFTRAMQQPVQILHGLALPGKRIANSVSTPTSNTRTHHQFRTRKRSLLPHRSPPPLPPPRAESSPAIVRL